METRNWVCPTLCGCELNITAEWLSPLSPGERSYQHPKPGTITTVTIGTVCAAHAHFQTDPPLDETYSGEMSGYLLRPTTTEAERLYVGLMRYSGTLYRPDTCGCHNYQVWDRTATEPLKTLQHALHSSKCTVQIIKYKGKTGP